MSSTTSTPPAGQHLAAILPQKGGPLSLVYRPTPQPGPGELLIEVKAIAMNPVDYFQRDVGFLVPQYPTVLGSDVSGLVVRAGADVASDAPQPGTRVTAFASAFWHQGEPDHGAFQQFTLVPAENVAPLPDTMSFREACILPMAVETALSGWYSIGLARDTKYTPEDRQGLLVWGGATSVGSAALQSAKLMGFRVYATSSPKHHESLKTWGAARVFDYHSDDVVSQIVHAAIQDGISLRLCYMAAQGGLEPSIEVLKQLKGDDGIAKIASAPVVPPDAPTVDGVEVTFVSPPEDPKPRSEHFHWVYTDWLKEKLETGEFVPSPRVKVIKGGLEATNKALDELKQGVSGTKLVIEL